VLRAPRGRPLALAAVDRGLREVAPGRYETRALFPAAGRYVLPVLVQGGSFAHCFDVEVGGPEGDARMPLSARLRLEYAGDEARLLPAGAPAPLRLRLSGPQGDAAEAWQEAGDLQARIVQFAGHWQALVPLRPLGEGLYEAASVTVPRPGAAVLHVESASLGLQPGSLPPILLRAVAP
jgi:hypothetical protein